MSKTNTQTELEKMLSGQVYDGADQKIDIIRTNAKKSLMAFNNHQDPDQQHALQEQLFGKVGSNSLIQPPFHCEFGKTIEIGNDTFINMNVVMLDGANIKVGNNVLIGPSAQFYTPSHSLDYRSRRKWETFCLPITIEDDVWIGGNSVINQGVTIGARSVIAANSVVNSDVPPDCLYGGTPAKLIRHLNTDK
ncbi:MULTISPECIES: sugar O-acetyltransferase [Vibrio]|uniref:Sugar O-acetyltransferase n=3 Tax=Vibrio TaxID=662 RepID=A0ABV4LDI0_9VIBR|nr:MULTISPECIES: sugar O-acetyltransferase [Vibrio]MCG9559209.1 sugar O-acetyltransferase [Vibrio kanaloae]NOH99675.1 sugar O-acetyltransferase [Vibrio kanaloae]NOI99193.1 sugar O-acetyltransferase [Vibrio kanaloae]OEF14856.1 acetyltransferase [Vibrio kanaloae 5S-149]TKE97388.1 sugar O-acetyltransferase [Vibrio kanaloae]